MQSGKCWRSLLRVPGSACSASARCGADHLMDAGPSDWSAQGLHRNSPLDRRVQERHSTARRQGSALTREEWEEIRRERSLEKLRQQQVISAPAVTDLCSSRFGEVNPATSVLPDATGGGCSEPAATVEPTLTCIVCFESVASDATGSGRCGDFFASHIMCRACCIGHVTEQTDPMTSMETLRAQGRPDGGVKCPVAGCKYLWDPATIARLVPADLFDRACELRMRVREHSIYAKAQTQLAEEVAKINVSSTVFESTRTARKPRHARRSASQCAQSSYAPVAEEACAPHVAGTAQAGAFTATCACITEVAGRAAAEADSQRATVRRLQLWSNRPWLVLRSEDTPWGDAPRWRANLKCVSSVRLVSPGYW